MRPPLLSVVTWNRMSLSVRNIVRLLKSEDDFEMHIVDNASKDHTWNFINDLKDSRIKSRTRMDINRGPVYAFNYNMAKREKDQYFVNVENDVYIHTLDWISRFMEIFDTFTEVALLGIPRPKPYPEFLPPVVSKVRDGVCYLKLKNAVPGEILDFIPRCCLMFRPEIFNYIGYWDEESAFTDAEISARIVRHTPYTVGFATNIRIEQTQCINCSECSGTKWCLLEKTGHDCMDIWCKYYKNPRFAEENVWKNKQFFDELESGKRNAYCASIHDPSSMAMIGDSVYHEDWVKENIRFYEEHAN